MTARDFLIRGLLAGLLAGLAAFAVAYVVGEPHVDKAIAIEEAGSDPVAPLTDSHTHAHGGESDHQHGEDAAVSRQDQSTWGLATGTVTIGVTFGGVLGLVAAAAMGRIAHLSPGTSTALVGVIGFVSVVVIPFFKYPATPPAVGDGDTIGQRTILYFAFVLVSLLAAAACTALAAKLIAFRGVQGAVLIGSSIYFVIVALAAVLMPTFDEIGDFPANVLWDFRLASLITLTALWATIGIALTSMVRRLDAQYKTVQARRKFAASL
ncbi:CbtA family protein [Mycolicibacterium baixiangningiae]|uniref:CbtA family protein n=1 Tax=Mycolicibacterium baixiangningiae TaxID=2761578 RepID=UPI0018D0CBD0|nr:CbtA family protein [Mycolicibacterium baixiangningiae]